MIRKLLFFCSLFSCLFNIAFCDYCDLAHQVMNKYSKKIKKSDGLQLIGSGGRMPEDVEAMIVHYVSYDKHNVESARRLLVKGVEGLILETNLDKKIRPFLHNYPFTHRNVDFTINFYGSDGSFMNKPYLSGVCLLENGNVYYNVWNAESRKLEDFHDETYEGALRIVQTEIVPFAPSNK
jgi:hypothetical protein